MPRIFVWRRHRRGRRAAVAASVVFLLGLASSVSAFAGAPLAHWSLDDGAGSLAADRSGGVPGSLGAEGVWTRGRLGGALEFDGVDDVLVVDSVPELDLADTLAISFWIRSDSTAPGFPAVVWKLDSGVSGFKVQKWNGTDALSLRVDTSAGTGQSGSGGELLPGVFDGAWHHVVWVLDRGRKRGYLDGALVVDAFYLHGDGFSSASDLSWMANTGGGLAVGGALDDLRVYDRPLEDQEVAELWHRGLSDPAGCDEIVFSHPMFTNPAIRPTFDPDLPWVRDPIIDRDIVGDGNVFARGPAQYVPVAEYPDQPLVKCGFFDPTAPPFNADPSGRPESASANTTAFNDALRVARQHTMAVLVPPGRYVVDGKVECVQGLTAAILNPDTGKRHEDRQGACVLLGSRRDEIPPEIILESGAVGFDDPLNLSPLIIFWARNQTTPEVPQPGINFNNMIVGLALDLGGNPGAVGVDLDGAQGTGIEEVSIDATGAYAGLSVLPAAGGATHNLTVVGGRFGVDTAIPGPDLDLSDFIDTFSRGSVPTVSGSTFVGQTESAIRYRQQETLSVVGVRIVVPPGATGPAITSARRFESGNHVSGTMTLVDTSIEFEESNPSNLALNAEFSAYLHDVFVKNAETLLQTIDGDSFAGDLSDWVHVREYVANVRPFDHHETSVQYEEPSFVDGVRNLADSFALGPAGPPPADLQARHQWDRSRQPSPESFGVVNVKLAPYSAAGDGRTDDTATLQAAIDENEGAVLFFPKGYYKVTSTIDLLPSTRIVGVARHLSMLIAEDDPLGDFPDTRYGVDEIPVLRSADDPDGEAVVAFFGVQSPHEVPGAFALQWRTGERSVLRAFTVASRSRISDFTNQNDSPPFVPQVLISDSGGGRWYSYFRDFRYLPSWQPNSGFRMLKVEDTTEALRFYQANPEGQEEGGAAKVEVAQADNVEIYGYKDENKQKALILRDSSRFKLFGYGGISYVVDGEALFEVERSDDFLLAGLFIRANPSNDGNPGEWSMVRETLDDGSTFETPPLDLPTLYRRTGPSDLTAPVLTELVAIATPTLDRTPTYEFTSSEAGTLSVSGGCETSQQTAFEGENRIEFDRLAPGRYDICQVALVDEALNASAPLSVSPFAIVDLEADLMGTCPGTLDLTVSGGTPNGTVAVLRGSGFGAAPLPAPPCPDFVSGLVDPQVAALIPLDANGGAVLSRSLPAELCADLVQLVDRDTCSSTAPASFP